MAKFKVGDVVKHVHNDYFQGHNFRNSRLIVEVDNSTYYFKDGGIIGISIAEEKGGFYEIELVKSSRIEKEEKQMKKGWSFKVTAPAYEINFNELAQDVSRQNPVALVHVEGQEETGDYVVIDAMLLDKAVLCGWSFEDEFSIPSESIGHYETACVYKTSRVEFNDIVEWAKKVRKASYPKEVRNKAVVQVDFPSI